MGKCPVTLQDCNPLGSEVPSSSLFLRAPRFHFHFSAGWSGELLHAGPASVPCSPVQSVNADHACPGFSSPLKLGLETSPLGPQGAWGGFGGRGWETPEGRYCAKVCECHLWLRLALKGRKARLQASCPGCRQAEVLILEMDGLERRVPKTWRALFLSWRGALLSLGCAHPHPFPIPWF